MYSDRDWKRMLQFWVQFLYEYPREETVTALGEMDFYEFWPKEGGEALPVVGVELLQQYLSQESSAKLDELRQDYSDLFCGPGVPLSPPWMSYYLDPRHQLNTDDTIEYKSFVLSMFPDFSNYENHPFDHVGIHLAFIFATLERFGLDETWIKQYYLDYMGDWFFEFTEKLITNAKTDFYIGVGYLLESVFSSLVSNDEF